MRVRFDMRLRSRQCALSLAAILVSCLACSLRADELTSPPKLSSSLFDAEELADLVNNGLLIPRPTSPLPRGMRPVRTLHGEVVDAEGRPILGAYVSLSSPADGQYGTSYFDNYDMTDELGRFVVADFDFRTTVHVHRAPGLSWQCQIEPDQTTLRVQWPANGRVRSVMPPELEHAEHGVYLQLVRKTAGVGAKRLGPVVVDAQGSATFAEVPPGEFRIFTPIHLKRQRREDEYAEQELGRFALAPGEAKDVVIDAAARVAVRGEVGPDAECVVIEHEPTRQSQLTGGVDGVQVGDDGSFAAYVSGPGVYRLTVLAKPMPLVNGQPAGRVYVNGVIAKRRFIVDGTTGEVHIPLDDDLSPTAAFVHRTLDSEMFQGGDDIVSFSMTDVKVAGIVRHEDPTGVAKELLRILNDPNCPQSWEYLAFEALGKMIETPGVVAGLLDLLRRDNEASFRGRVIRALSDANAELPRIATEVASFGRDVDRLLRWEVRYCLGRMVFKHPELRDQVAPTLIAGLTDSFDRTRQGAAATLGSLKCEAALPALRPLLSDRNIHVRLAAARAIWNISGDAEPLVTLAGGILQHDDEDFELKTDAAHALRGLPKLPTRTIGALMRYARNAPPEVDIRDRSKTAHHGLGKSCRQVLDDYVAAETSE